MNEKKVGRNLSLRPYAIPRLCGNPVVANVGLSNARTSSKARPARSGSLVNLPGRVTSDGRSLELWFAYSFNHLSNPHPLLLV
jgi:hypothetical protein